MDTTKITMPVWNIRFLYFHGCEVILCVLNFALMIYAGFRVHKILRLTNFKIEMMMIMINATFVFSLTISIKEFVLCVVEEKNDGKLDEAKYRHH